MNMGLLGAGRIGAFHGKVLAAHEDVHTLMIGDIDAERAAAVAKEVGGQPRLLENADNPRVLRVLRDTDYSPKQ